RAPCPRGRLSAHRRQLPGLCSCAFTRVPFPALPRARLGCSGVRPADGYLPARMKVVHLNTSDFGGAAMAAINLHVALLEQGVDSHLLTLNKTRHDIPQHAVVAPFELHGTPMLDRLRYKARRLLEATGLVEDRSNTP